MPLFSASLLVKSGFFDCIFAKIFRGAPTSPVISCIGEGTTEWQRFECVNMFIRVPGVTVPKLQKIALKENVLQRF